MTAELVIFVVTGAVAVAAALGMLLSPNAVHSALFLIINFGALAVLFLVLEAPLLAAVQVTVYAGAIMVLFLFVVMLLGAERAEAVRDELRWQRPLGIVLGLALVALIAFVLIAGGPLATPAAAGQDIASPALLGRVLFNDYLLPFEITSILLLVAMVGVILLAGRTPRTAEGEGSMVEPARAEEPAVERAG